MVGVLLLGPIAFDGFEVPQAVRFGGKQRLVVHALPGGGRVVDRMGPDEAPLVWAGIFSGPGAAQRVRLLEAFRRAGTVLPLTWSSWRYSVVIESFEADSANPAWIPYRVKCCVIAAEAMAEVDWLLGTTVAEAGAFGAGLDATVAESGLISDDVATAVSAAGQLAQLNAGRAFLAFTGDNGTI